MNTVVGFIGPEYLYDSKQIQRAGLEDHFCGKLLVLPMGVDICYTNHAEADQDDMDVLLTLLANSGCNFIMGIPGADDIMLNYQSTSFHDAAYIRKLLNLKPASHQSAVSVACGFLDIVKTTRLSATPVCLVTNGRVAIGDEIGELLGVQLTVVPIGERPGLSSPNSLGAYLTYAPSLSTTDDSRNCISNIRPGGLTVGEAVRKIAYLTGRALAQKITGVELKDRMIDGYLPLASLAVSKISPTAV